MDPMDVVKSYQAAGIGLSKVGTDPDLLRFHEAAAKAISDASAAAARSAKSVDLDLKPEVVKARRIAIFVAGRLKLEKQIGGLIDSVLGPRLRAAKQLFAESGNPAPKDAIEAVTYQSRVEAARRQLEALPLSDRARAAGKLADAGDARFLPVFADSVVELLPAETVKDLTSRYYAKCAGPQARYLLATEEAIEEALGIQRASGVVFLATASALGIPANAIAAMTPSDFVNALPVTLKAAFTARFGPEALAEVADGKRPMDDLADLL